VTRVAPAHVAAGAAVAGLCLADAVRVRSWGLLACLALLGLALPRRGAAALLVALAAWWWGGVRLDALDASVLRADVDRAGRGVAVTTAEARRGSFALRQLASMRRFDGRRVDERVELELPLGRAPPQGAVIRLLAVVRAPNGPSHGFDERTWLRRQGIHVVLHVDEWSQAGGRGGLGGAGDGLRRWLRAASSPGLTGERRAVLEGILLGDDNGLSPGLKQAFRRSGLYHLLAVSGQNVVLLAGGVLVLAMLLGLSRAAGHACALGAIAAYVLAVGPQPSVIRAAVAGGATSIAWLAGRDRDPWHVLLLAAVVLLAWNPYALFDAGFQLSFAAVVAIFLVVPFARRVLEGYPLSTTVGMPVAISAACTVATAPILWLQFGQVPLLGVVANVLVELAIPPLLGLAFAAALADPVCPPLAELLAWANGWLAAYVDACARAIAAAPIAQVTGDGAAVVAAAALAAAAVCVRRVRTSAR
jgi:competence protein ComEC